MAEQVQGQTKKVVRERLGNAVKDIVFDHGTMLVPALSPQHHRMATERTAGPILKLVQALSASDPATAGPRLQRCIE